MLQILASESLKSSYTLSNPPRSNRLVLNVSNGGPWNPKPAPKEKKPLGKIRSSKFCQSGVKQTRFQNLKEKEKWIIWS